MNRSPSPPPAPQMLNIVPGSSEYNLCAHGDNLVLSKHSHVGMKGRGGPPNKAYRIFKLQGMRASAHMFSLKERDPRVMNWSIVLPLENVVKCEQVDSWSVYTRGLYSPCSPQRQTQCAICLPPAVWTEFWIVPVIPATCGFGWVETLVSVSAE